MFPISPRSPFARQRQDRNPLTRAAVGALAVTVASAASMVVAVSSAGAIDAGDQTNLRLAFADSTETAINLTSDITLTCAGGGPLLRGSDTPITITGNGHTLTQSCGGTAIAAQANAGAITIDQLHLVAADDGITTAGDLTANDVTIAGASAGTAFRLHPGRLELHRVAVTGFDQGADVDGSGRIDHSSFDGAAGTGIAFSGDGRFVDINYSSVTGAGGSGVVVDGGFLRLLNSTVAGNGGDGIATDHAGITLVHATVVGNAIASLPFTNGNITSSFGHLTSSASVVALAGGGLPDCSIEALNFSSHSFSSDSSCGFTDPTDQSGAGDPQLGPLQDNGGLGRSRLPAAASPLIDVVPPAACGDGEMVVHDDQRDAIRPIGPSCDIGALEVQVGVPATTTTTTSTPTTSTTSLPSTTAPSTTVPATPEVLAAPAPAPGPPAAAVAVTATPAFTG